MAGGNRVKVGSSRFKRKLRRLECIVNFKGSISGRGQVREGWVIDLVGKWNS